MTDREKAIVMAYTGICMLNGDKFHIFHKYIEDIMGRPIYTHELAYETVEKEIKEKAKDDFLKLCAEDGNDNAYMSTAYISTPTSYCPNCGIRMEGSHNEEEYVDEHGYYHLSHDMYERLRRGEPVPPISSKI